MVRQSAVVAAVLLAASSASAEPPVPAQPGNLRSTDEIATLYGNAVLYGAGSAMLVDLYAKPSDPVVVAMPFVGFTAASVGAVAVTDMVRPFHRGEPATIAAGLELGLGSGIFLVGMQNAHAHRKGGTPWPNETAGATLWGMSTFGGFIGSMFAFGIHPPQGRVSFITSTSVWSGLITALVVGAVSPDDPRRLEMAYALGNGAYGGGAIVGMILPVNPSVTRVRIVDAGGVGAGLLALGLYAAAAQADFDSRAVAGVGAAGAGAGLFTAWILTRRMPSASQSRTTGTLTVHPTLLPLPGGAGLGVGGTL